MGDVDDAIMFTVRSRGEPFVGRLYPATNNVYESQTAEVVYFLAQSGNEPILDPSTATPTRLFTLYRRALLVVPGLPQTLIPSPSVPTPGRYYDYNDLSSAVCKCDVDDGSKFAR